MSLVVVNCWG